MNCQTCEQNIKANTRVKKHRANLEEIEMMYRRKEHLQNRFSVFREKQAFISFIKEIAIQRKGILLEKESTKIFLKSAYGMKSKINEAQSLADDLKDKN